MNNWFDQNEAQKRDYTEVNKDLFDARCKKQNVRMTPLKSGKKEYSSVLKGKTGKHHPENPVAKVAHFRSSVAGLEDLVM